MKSQAGSFNGSPRAWTDGVIYDYVRLELAAPTTQAASDASKTIDVYLIGGQSNATGQGYMANLPKNVLPDGRVLLFHSGKPHLNSGAKPDTWVPLRQASESPDRFGPEFGFGNRIQELFPDRKIALIKHAHSGANLYKDWDPGKDASDEAHFGPQFKVFVETVQSGLAGLRAKGYQPRLIGMIWQQGESDTKSESAAAAYGGNLARFVGRVRQQLTLRICFSSTAMSCRLPTRVDCGTWCVRVRSKWIRTRIHRSRLKGRS